MKANIQNIKGAALAVVTAVSLSFITMGCDREVSHSETTKVNGDGTVTSKEKTTTQSSDGTVTKKEETKKTTTP